MLLAEIKNIFRIELQALYPQEEIDAFFYELLEHFLGLERFILVVNPKLTVSKEEEQPFFEGLSDLKRYRPIQYITGVAYFMDLKIKVNEQVLIPRPETEELVDWVLKDCKVERVQDINILDIGTGSGCIAMALAKTLGGAQVYALDISKKSLEVAKENAELNDVNVNFMQGDLLNLHHGSAPKFDIIISNPPYVREKEKKEISDNVKMHEPSVALFVPDENPLKFYEGIAQYSKNALKPEGKLYLEINQYLAEETKTLFENHNFGEIEVRKDHFGNDRMLKGVKI